MLVAAGKEKARAGGAINALMPAASRSVGFDLWRRSRQRRLALRETTRSATLPPGRC